MSSKPPIELMPRNPHPLFSLTRIFGGFCDPVDDAVDRDEEERESSARGIKSTAIAPEPAQEELAPPPHIAPKEVAHVSKSRELSLDTAIPQVPEERNQEKEPVVVTTIEPKKVVKKPASILKTHKASSKSKKKNVVAVESGKSERVVRILETAVLTVVFVVATILVLRGLGHTTDLSFGKGGGKLSSPIRFDFRTNGADKPVVMDVDAKVIEAHKVAEVLEPEVLEPELLEQEDVSNEVKETEDQVEPQNNGGAEDEGEESVKEIEETSEKESDSIPDEPQDEVIEDEEPTSETIEDRTEQATEESILRAE